MTYYNGDIYEGNWVDGKKQGQGTYRNKKGEFYEGYWVNGKMEGKGIYTWKTTFKVKEGLFGWTNKVKT